MLRRGITIPWGALTGALLIALPIVKGTGLSLYPVAGAGVPGDAVAPPPVAPICARWVALALGALLVAELSAHVLSSLQPSAAATGSAAISTNASAAREALHHIPSFLAYLWQAVLPRLSFMARSFPPPPPGLRSVHRSAAS